MEKIPLVANFNDALEFAIETRRGVLLNCAPLPKLEEIDMEVIRATLAALINTLGEREQTIHRLEEQLDKMEEVLRSVAKNVSSLDLSTEGED